MKYEIGDLVTDEEGHYKGIVCIKWNDGDICALENDAAHPNPIVVGHWTPSNPPTTKRELRVGDKGQRYEVRFVGSNGKEYVAGWTDDADGKPFVESINKHPIWHNPKVIDREKSNTPNPPDPQKPAGGG